MSSSRSSSRATVVAASSVLAALLVGCNPLVHVPTPTTPKPTLTQSAATQQAATPSASATSTSVNPLTPAAVTFASDIVDVLAADKGQTPPPGTGSASLNLALNSLPFEPSLTCVRCDSGPAVAAAALYTQTKVSSRKVFAITSVDTLIAAVKQPTGALAVNSTSPDVDTMFMAANIGETALLLKPYLDPVRLQTWTSAVTDAADYLIANGNTSWYTNGNVVVGNSLVFAIAYKLTGNVKYLTAYNSMLSFATAPAGALWVGFGFVTLKAATKADGSDGRGYFTEAGVNGPGFDPDYTMLQSDQLARLYLINKDPQVLRLLNMTTNMLLATVDPATGFMPGMGTRHQVASEFFDGSGPAVLASAGGREDLAAGASVELNRTAARWAQDVRMTAPLGDRGYYALGMIPVSIMLAGTGILG